MGIKNVVTKAIKQCIINLSGKGEVFINGEKIEAKDNISIINNEVYADGVKIEDNKVFNIDYCKHISIQVTGNTGHIDCTGDIEVTGNVNGSIDCGDITVNGNVAGNIDACDGVTITGDVTGDIDAGNSVIVHSNVTGNIDACDDVTIQGDHSNGYINAGDHVYIGSAR